MVGEGQPLESGVAGIVNLGRDSSGNAKVIPASTIDSPATNQLVLDTIVGNITSGTAKTAGTDWFVSDVSYDDEIPEGTRAAPCRCDFFFEDADAVISFTFDGTNYASLNEGIALKAGSLYSIAFGGENGNLFNIKASANVTIQKCVVAVEGKQEPV